MKKDTVKNIARFIGSFAVGGLASLLVKQNVVPKNVYEKVVVGLGSFVVSGMVSSKAEDYIDKEIDTIYDSLSSFNELNALPKKEYSQTADKKEGDE